ncbi:MAG: PAT family beta-lactamase induction signal transducer AmpG [Kiritimatiellia bacterium]|jgi:MFS transporter, PAT family, beta-lactamase induction signal transducer AmpG
MLEATLDRPAASYSQRMTLLASLYVTQAVPLGFFIEAVPAIGRDLGLSLATIGMLQALALPFMLKFLWAPMVDRVGSPRRGHYRSWLIPLQVSAALLLAMLAVFSPQFLSPWMLLGGAVFMLLASTQDIATDGLAVKMLEPQERGMGNGVQVGGFYLGQILGGGLILVVYGLFGWRAALLTMAALMALPLLSLHAFVEPAGSPLARASEKRPGWRTFGRFFKRPGGWIWLAVLLFYRAGDAMAITMAKPMWIDLGYSLTQIGLLIGLGNSFAAMAGALLGGAWVSRLGRKRALVGFAALHAIALLGYILPASGWSSAAVVWPVSVCAAFAGGMATAALYTCMMDRVDPEVGGTEFTLQQALAAVGPMVGAGLSGVLSQATGYPVHFALCAMLTLAMAALSLRVTMPRLNIQ